jgi:hypothetical protein
LGRVSPAPPLRFTIDESHRQKSHLASATRGRHAHLIDETIITRDEVVALLFNVSDIADSLAQIQGLLEEDDGEEDDEGRT